MVKPIHLKKQIEGDYRLIAISDIHGHLDRLKALLKKVNYQSSDYLVIVGDFVEKGDQVLETIHYIQELDKNERVFVLAGNCEWALESLLTIPDLSSQIPQYLKRVSANGCIRTIYNQYDFYNKKKDSKEIQKTIANELKEELKYLSDLPVSLKINEFLFVHAGIEKRKDYESCGLSSLLEMQRFLDDGHLLDEMVIVGHLPTSNYKNYEIDNNVIIDKEKKVICIDGGTGVKPISQLNALIIQSKHNKIKISYDYVQDFPIYHVKKDYQSQQTTFHKISYPYFEVDILEKYHDFSYCLQKQTNTKLYIKNEFLYQRNNHNYCLDDYTDCFLNIKKGDIIQVVGVYGHYIYAIKDGQVGWVKDDYMKEEVV